MSFQGQTVHDLRVCKSKRKLAYVQAAREEEVIAATEENMIFKLPRQLTD